MRIAVLSDIHGNIAALDAVLDHVAGQSAELVVNLGDICSGPLWPAETADRLMPLDVPTIRGNHERQVLEPDMGGMGLSDRHARHVLKADHLDWLAGLPATMRLTDDVLLVHGTPGSDLLYFMETVTAQGVRAASAEEVALRAAKADAALILCGHTHVARSFRLDDGRLIVNPGSVGLPAYEDSQPFPHAIENGSPHARYAIVSDESGRWEAFFHHVDYDWDRAARKAEANGRPDWARALRTGLV